MSGCGDAYAAGVGVSIANLAAVGPDGLVDVLSNAFGGAVSVSQTIGDAAAVSQGIAIAFASELPSELTGRALFMAVYRTDRVPHKRRWCALVCCLQVVCLPTFALQWYFLYRMLSRLESVLGRPSHCLQPALSQVTYRRTSSSQTLHTPSRKSPALLVANEPQRCRLPFTMA